MLVLSIFGVSMKNLYVDVTVFDFFVLRLIQIVSIFDQEKKTVTGRHD